MLFFLLEYYQWSAIELSDDHDPGLVPSVIPSSTLHFLPVLLGARGLRQIIPPGGPDEKARPQEDRIHDPSVRTENDCIQAQCSVPD